MENENPAPETVQEDEKKRNVFFTVWLIITGIATGISSLLNLFLSEWIADNNPGTPDWGPTGILVIGLLGLLMVASVVAIWNWRKWGVILNAILALAVCVINIMLGLNYAIAIFGLVGSGIIVYLTSKQWNLFRW